MAHEADAELKQLAGDFYHGLLTFESYREQRGRLLDELEARRFGRIEASPDETARRPALAVAGSDEPEPAEPVRAAPARAAPAPAPPPVREAEPARRGRGGRLVALAAGVGLVAAGAIGFVVWQGTLRGGADEAAPAPSLAGPSAPGVTLIEQFLARNDWTEDSRSNFVLTWGTLSDPQRREAVESGAFRRLGDSLRRRLLEEEALGGASASAEFRALLDFADGLDMPFAADFEARLAAADVPAAVDIDAGEPGDVGTVPDSDPLLAESPPDVELPDPVAPAIDDALPAEPPALDSPGSESAGAESAPEAPGSAESDESPGAGGPASAESDESPAADGPASAEAVAPDAVDPVDSVDPIEAADPTDAAPASDAATAATDDPCRAELAATRRPYCQDRLADGTPAPGLAILPPGAFTMGSAARPEEGPRHEVAIERAFAMSVYEVSHTEFAAFCEATARSCPERAWNDDDAPVVLVAAADADAYAAWLSAETGHSYRLPSEAEWEYAARAGTETPYFFGDEITPAWARSSANVPVDGPVARSDESVNRNPFRLYHMAGNVREWVADAWHDDHAGAPADGSPRSDGAGSRRVVRGGSYADPAFALRSAARQGLDPTTRDRQTGFRIVRDLLR